MTREDHLLGEIIAARGLAQMLAITLVTEGIVSSEAIESRLAALVGQWSDRSCEPGCIAAAGCAIAAVRLGEFLAEFRTLVGSATQ